ncbi:hypothetical protein [Pyruvatibacter mobilis]|uniref:hypothetical protein n=1 Tax=Pyruvatibacter mobilis TaxID=1712261 RepID=UPI003C7E0614
MGKTNRFIFPPKRAFPAPAAAAFAAWALEQAVGSADWWGQLPWGWIAVCFLAFWFGQLFNDAFNPRSWLRHNWRSLWAIGAWSDVLYDSVFLDPPENADMGPEGWFNQRRRFLSVAVELVTYGYRRSPIHIRIVARPYRLKHGKLISISAPNITKSFEVAAPKSKGERIPIPVAYIVSDKNAGIIGQYGIIDETDFNTFFNHARAYDITIDVRSGWRRQSRRLVLMLPYSRHAQNTHDVETGGIFSVYEEDRGPFDDLDTVH